MGDTYYEPTIVVHDTHYKLVMLTGCRKVVCLISPWITALHHWCPILIFCMPGSTIDIMLVYNLAAYVKSNLNVKSPYSIPMFVIFVSKL